MNLEVEQRLLEKIRKLPSERVMEVEDFIDFLNQRVDTALRNPAPLQSPSSSGKRKISEFKGIVEHPFVGEDAQAWISRSRQLSDAQRNLGSREVHDS